jgi:hypothetical protein
MNLEYRAILNTLLIAAFFFKRLDIILPEKQIAYYA